MEFQRGERGNVAGETFIKASNTQIQEAQWTQCERNIRRGLIAYSKVKPLKKKKEKQFFKTS